MKTSHLIILIILVLIILGFVGSHLNAARMRRFLEHQMDAEAGANPTGPSGESGKVHQPSIRI